MCRLKDVLNKKISLPSNGALSLHHQEDGLVLKSPNMTENDGLQALMSDRRFQSLLKNSRIFCCSDWESDKDLI